VSERLRDDRIDSWLLGRIYGDELGAAVDRAVATANALVNALELGLTDSIAFELDGLGRDIADVQRLVGAG
jgi:hypothetical protein